VGPVENGWVSSAQMKKIREGYESTIVFFVAQNLVDQQMEEFKKYGKLYGKFEGTKPNIYIGDCDLVRSVLVKDFDHFINRRVR